MNNDTHVQTPIYDHSNGAAHHRRHPDRAYPRDLPESRPEPPLRHTHPCSFPSGKADPAYPQPETDPEATPLLLTVMETARMLSIGRTKVYELLGSGHLEEVHIGRATRIPVDSVLHFVEHLRWNASRRR